MNEKHVPEQRDTFDWTVFGLNAAVSFLAAVIVVYATTVFLITPQLNVDGEENAGSAVVVMDTESVLRAAILGLNRAFTEGEITSKDLDLYSERVSTVVTALLDQYAREGVVVLPVRLVLAYPESHDHTHVLVDALKAQNVWFANEE